MAKIHIKRPFNPIRPHRKTTYCGLYGDPAYAYYKVVSPFTEIEDETHYCKHCLRISGRIKKSIDKK